MTTEHSPKYVFLDRDGVINQDSPDYIKNWSEFRFLPRSLEALALLRQNGCRVVVITNQSIIGRGMASSQTLADTHRNMTEAVVQSGGKIHAIYFCPHVPDYGCTCRKPAPGLILKAAEELNINLSQTAMIGDNAKDVLAARAAGCGKAILVRTGNGNSALESLAKKNASPDHVANDLLDAVEWLLAQDRPSKRPGG